MTRQLVEPGLQSNDGAGKVQDRNKITRVTSFPAAAPLCIAEENLMTTDKEREMSS